MFDVDTINPYGPYVLLRRLPVAGTTDSKLVLPDAQVTKNLRCVVLKVGQGEWVNGTFVHSGLVTDEIVIVRQFDGNKLGKKSGASRDVLLVHHDMIEAKVLEKPWPALEERDHGTRRDQELPKVQQ